MANLAIQSPNVELTLASAASGGDEFLNTENTVVLAVNADSMAAKEVTIAVQRSVIEPGRGFGTQTISNIVLSIPASGRAIFDVPPLPYNKGNGRAGMTYDDNTMLSFAVVDLDRD